MESYSNPSHLETQAQGKHVSCSIAPYASVLMQLFSFAGPQYDHRDYMMASY